MASVTRPSGARQDTPADCRHSKEPFDQGFHVVSRRADLTSDAKVVHAFLVSLYRSGKDMTQADIADELGTTRHRVWSAIRELVTAGLIETIRYGLGRPNGYVLLGIAPEDLDGKAKPETGIRTGRRQPSGQSGNPTRARSSSPKRRNDEEPEQTRPKAEGPRPTPAPLDPRRAATACLVCPGELHAPDACPATTPVVTAGGPCAYCRVEHGPPECMAWMFGGRS